MKILVKPIRGLIHEGAGGVACIIPEAKPLWLVGRATDEELFIWSAWEILGTDLASFQRVSALLPCGLAVLGIFYPHGAVTQLHSRLPALRLSASEEDGVLHGQVAGTEVRDWKVAQPSDLLIRASLEVSLPPTEAVSTLKSMIRDARQLHFRFPGSTLLPTLSDLRSLAVGPTVSVVPNGKEVVVEVFSEDFGASGCSNFLDFTSSVPLTQRMDFAAYVPQNAPVAKMAEELVEAAVQQLNILLAAQDSLGDDRNLSVRCFLPELLGHAVCLRGTEDRSVRQELHRLLRLPEEPLLVPDAALALPGQALARASGKPMNPHAECGLQPAWWKGGETTQRAFVRGLYEYNHYMQDNFDDNGWGCAYRSLQTCVSWYRMQHYSTEGVPSIPEIQRLLKCIDEAHKDLEIGSKKWIGTVEGMYLLQEYLKVDCKLMYCQDCADMASQAPQMLQHLETEGTPIMMGAGMYAYTLVGLCFDSASGDVAYLIVDPHYTGKDDLKPILSKGWVGWKTLDFGLVIQACWRGAWEQAVQLLEMAGEQQLPLDSKTYASAMRACLEPSRPRLKAAEHAMSLYDDFLQSTEPPGIKFFVTAAAACEAMIALGRFQQVRDEMSSNLQSDWVQCVPPGSDVVEFLLEFAHRRASRGCEVIVVSNASEVVSAVEGKVSCLAFMFVDDELLMPGLRRRPVVDAEVPLCSAAPGGTKCAWKFVLLYIVVLSSMGTCASFPVGPDEWSWPKAMSTACCMDSRALLLLRCLLAVTYVGHACYDIYTYYDSGYYWMFLTHISLWCQVVCSVCLVTATMTGMRALRNDWPTEKSEPLICRVALALFSLQLPLSFMVVTMYWSLEQPVWDLPAGYHSSYENLYVHGLQSIGVLVTFLFGRIPFRVRQWVWLMLCGVVYCTWTYLHFLLRIGNFGGCPKYPRDECPIYAVFDWHKGLHTLILGCMLILVACPLVMSIFWLLGWVRDWLDKPHSGQFEADEQEPRKPYVEDSSEESSESEGPC
ncbi:unnamed protein product [Durusdinium trenchii]|uniref:UFSP1/2/DUB catalytic domain-containing protein n=1 Tax=Durusdinium trenchii TaxID=1381693 RepID=A0ABP0R1G5_9DINO